MARPRRGKPYIWATWAAKVLAGTSCLYSYWFRAHYQYEKYEEEAANLAEWNRNHTDMMRRRRQELEEDGWTVTEEEENAFKLEGAVAVLAGKPDLIATRDPLPLIPRRQVKVIDGKTGRERDSDIEQVAIYLFALQRARPDLDGDLEGEVQYARGQSTTITGADMTPANVERIASVIRLLASETAPKKAPSRDACRFCNIGPKDCPQRVSATAATLVNDF